MTPPTHRPAGFIQALQARSEEHPGGRTTLNRQAARELARQFGIGLLDLEGAALARGIVPLRLVRNADALDPAAQDRLRRGRVVLAGLGGLGGFVLEHLLRAGVGHVVAWDGDAFEETNLNRQLLATESTLGLSKAGAAAARAAAVNPAAEVRVVDRHVGPDDLPGLLDGADLLLDGLGGPSGRLMLQQAARAAGIPLVTGGVSGWCGFACTVMPGRPGPASHMPPDGSRTDEQDQGVIVSAVNLVACLQSSEALGWLAHRRASLAGRLLFVDLARMDFTTLVFDVQADGRDLPPITGQGPSGQGDDRDVRGEGPGPSGRDARRKK